MIRLPAIDCIHLGKSGCEEPDIGGDHWKPEQCYRCTIRDQSPRVLRPPIDSSVAVIILSHNYGHFLAEAIESVKSQTCAATEIVVVAESCSDNTVEVAKSLGIRVIETSFDSINAARKAGLESTVSPWVCFLDADDKLPIGYLNHAVRHFLPEVGIVYSDLKLFGEVSETRHFPPTLAGEELLRLNSIHSGAIVRRCALVASQALDVSPGKNTLEDWFAWRRVLACGWTAVNSREKYLYRRHSCNRSKAMETASYYEQFGMDHEQVTLIVPLSGRRWAWPALAHWLRVQEWPKSQVSLILIDSSGSEEFATDVENFLTDLQYTDCRVIKKKFASPGVCDDDRRNSDVSRQVQTGVAKLYAFASRLPTTNFTMILEDDVVPPVDAIKRLLSGFGPGTNSVSGDVPSRYHKGSIAWNRQGCIIESGEGLETIAGNGFGCVMLRTDVLKNALFYSTPREPDFDHGFYNQQRKNSCKIDWSIRCRHESKYPRGTYKIGNDLRPIMTWDHWPEEWEAQPLDRYRAGFLSGESSVSWISDLLSSDDPFSVWGMSDGDVAFWALDQLRETLGDHYWLKALAATSGFVEDDRPHVMSMFDDAFQETDHLLLQYGWPIAEIFTLKALESRSVLVESDGVWINGRKKRKVDCNCVYKLKPVFLDLIRGKKVFLISGDPRPLSEMLSSNGIKVSAAVHCSPVHSSKLKFLSTAQSEMDRHDWDLMVCSAGTASSILCTLAKKMGKQGLDIGHLDEALLKSRNSFQ